MKLMRCLPPVPLPAQNHPPDLLRAYARIKTGSDIGEEVHSCDAHAEDLWTYERLSMVMVLETLRGNGVLLFHVVWIMIPASRWWYLKDSNIGFTRGRCRKSYKLLSSGNYRRKVHCLTCIIPYHRDKSCQAFFTGLPREQEIFLVHSFDAIKSMAMCTAA